jgi:hypothetical protein
MKFIYANSFITRLANIVPEKIPQIRKKLSDEPAIAFNLSSLAVIPIINATVVL